jgi:stage III sporulation protein AF
MDLSITIDEDPESIAFGSLKTIDLTAGYKKQKTKDNLSKMEPIEIDKIKIGNEEEDRRTKERDLLTPEEINAKNLLSDFYNMKPDNINISIQE